MIWSTAYTKTALTVAGLGLGALILSEYTAHVRADAQAQATIQAQTTIIKQAQDDRAQKAKEDAARADAMAQLISSMKAQAAQQKTPVQIVGWSQAQLEQAIKGIQITVPAPTPENPHPSASVTIPEASLPGLRDTIEECKECAVKLTTAQQDIASRDAQMKLADQQIEALKTQRDAAIKAEKGGSWLRRTGRALKYVGIGAGIGAAALCGTGHCKL